MADDESIPPLEQDSQIGTLPQRHTFTQARPKKHKRQRSQHTPTPHRRHRHRQQPGAAPVRPAPPAGPQPPANIPSRWVGVDRSQIPQTTGHHPVPDPAWMGTLMDNSNLRFTGAYVTGVALSGNADNLFTNSSKAVARGWMSNMQTLSDQGWGAAFFYVGYSVGGGEAAPSTGVDTARGTLHGLHLRTTLNALGNNFAGAVVYVDNEDSTSTVLTQNLIDYYNGLFAEMSRPDPNLAAYRPGLYGHGDPLKTMLLSRKDLYLWDVWLDTATTNTPTPPFTPTVDPIVVDPVTRPLKAYVVTPTGAGAQPFIVWPIGRQFRFYTEQLPAAGSATATRLHTWRRVKTWDFDISFVRNPAFPEGDPRIGVVPRAGVALLVSGSFVARGTGTSTTPPLSQLTQRATGGNTSIPVANTVTVEPDAPVVLFPAAADMTICTVLNNGSIGIGSLSAASAWTAIDVIQGTVPVLRRIRAIDGVSRLNNESMLFVIGADNKLYVKRKQGTNNWEDAVVVNQNVVLHPFSRLSATTSGGFSVDVFYINNQGLLSSAFWTQAFLFTSTWPGFSAYTLERTVSFLPDAAIKAVVPRAGDILVFGVGNDLRLRFTFFVQGQGWTPPAAVGQPQDLIGSHTHLAAHAINDTTVEVAALTDAGQATIYTFQRAGVAWTPQPRVVVADPPALAGAIPVIPRGAVLQPADGFRINPFGDLGLFRAPGAQASTLFCAGLRNGNTNVLIKDLSAAGVWQFFV